MLEREGVVVHVPRAGSRIVALTLQDAFDVTIVREQLETLAVRHGVPASDDAFARLDAAARDMEVHADAGDEASVPGDGLAFHTALVGLARNGHLDAAYATIALPIAIFMRLNRHAQADTESLSARAARHRRIVDLVADGDPEAVLAEIRSHRTAAYVRGGGLSVEGASAEALAWAAGVDEGAASSLKRH